MVREKAYFNWSSGKDSALALYKSLRSERLSVRSLFTVLQRDSGKIAMHEVGTGLLRRQADAIGLPLTLLLADSKWTGEEYGLEMAGCMDRFKAQHITTALFGDLHLEPLRKERERKCNEAGMKAEFPLWGMSPKDALSEFIRLGFKAIVTCVDNTALPETFVGRAIDESFLAELPEGTDVCGENGEYHSFVFDGPIFRRPVSYRINGTYSRTFTDGKTNAVRRYTYLELE